VIIGPKKFDHDGKESVYYSLITRLIHWLAALSCTVLIGTGMVVVWAGTPGFKEYLGGSDIIGFSRWLHAISAIIFSVSCLILFVQWVMPMVPRQYDIQWLVMAGGYLSKKKNSPPAHRFNAGQKFWFWLATLGGLVMAATGLFMYMMWGSMSLLRTMALLHHALAVAIVVMYIVHVYLTLFAVKGSILSMINGRKSIEEIASLHSLYYDELKGQGRI